MSRIHPIGSIPSNRPPKGAVHHSALTGAVLVPPTAFFVTRVDNQGVESDCTGAIHKLIEQWCDARGTSCAEVSRRFGYTAGRELANPGAPLEDTGAMPVAVADAFTSVGAVAETDCPSYDPAKINDRVLDNLDLLERAFPFRATVSLVEETGAARCAAIRAAVAARLPVSVSMRIGPVFEAWSGGDPYNGEPSYVGGHCMRVGGYRPGAILLVNSWGLDWGVSQDGVATGGCIWVTDEVIGSEQTYDVIILSLATAVEHVQ